jgi:hypothetical protein
MGATFHYEGGLQARIPAGVELTCFNAWSEAWTILPEQIERDGTFAVVSGAEYRRIARDEGWILLLPPVTEPQPLPGRDWNVSETRRMAGVTVLRVRRSPE